MAARREILIVEDDTGTINLLSHIVGRAGHNPVLARSGRQALEILRQARPSPDLALVDLMMKDIDGWGLLEAIRSDPAHGSMPVIIVSARDPREDPVRTAAHADKYEAYFVKPFAVEELVAKIDEILGKDALSQPPGTES